MGKWVNNVIGPSVESDSADHAALEDLARLADGTVDNGEREHLVRHINRCQRCYEVLHQTLKDVNPAAGAKTTIGPWWKTKTAYALAASIVLIFIIGGQFAYQYFSRVPGIFTATVDLDQNLKDILLEDDALQFGKGPRLTRLLIALQRSGLSVKELNGVILKKPYYQKKVFSVPAKSCRFVLKMASPHWKLKRWTDG